jgi:hypothetical protein
VSHPAISLEWHWLIANKLDNLLFAGSPPIFKPYVNWSPVQRSAEAPSVDENENTNCTDSDKMAAWYGTLSRVLALLLNNIVQSGGAGYIPSSSWGLWRMEEDGGTMKSEIRWCKTWLKHGSRLECSSCSPTRFSTILTAGLSMSAPSKWNKLLQCLENHKLLRFEFEFECWSPTSAN